MTSRAGAVCDNVMIANAPNQGRISSRQFKVKIFSGGLHLKSSSQNQFSIVVPSPSSFLGLFPSCDSHSMWYFDLIDKMVLLLNSNTQDPPFHFDLEGYIEGIFHIIWI
jgi:hypothetical protein